MSHDQQFMDSQSIEQFFDPQSETYGNTVPVPFGDYSGADSPLPHLHYDQLQSNSPLANLFLTGFDQQNPLPFGGGDVYMDDYPRQQGD